MTMKTFINPFHFVPPTEPVDKSPISAVRQSLKDNPPAGQNHVPELPHLLHDRYLASRPADGEPEHYSGRIVCRLTTQTPCVFGNEHRKVRVPQVKDGGPTLEEATRVENFSLAGHAAIAGTSLKGMLSTIAEMASGSAMRVLNNRVLSLRSSMKQARSAVGMIIVHKGLRQILPLALPTFSRPEGVYKPTDGSDNEIWHEIRCRRRSLDPDATLTAIYVRKDTPVEFCFHHDRTVVALPGRYCGIEWDEDEDAKRPKGERDQDRAVKKVDRRTLLRPVKREDTWAEVEPVDPAKDQTWGIVRRLQKPTVDTQGLEFSMFLPVSRQWRNQEGQFQLPAEHKDLLLLDAEDACREFDTIVTHEFSNAPDDPSCTALEGQDKFNRPTKSKRKLNNPGLREGDLVFFRPSSAEKVESVAIAGIWRERARWLWTPDSPQADEPDAEKPTLLDGPERRPMNRSRTNVTLAERLFGWVEGKRESKETPETAEDERFVKAYKGRVRVSDAVSERELERVQIGANPETSANADYADVRGYYPLKILTSPKPPCPELYMRRRTPPQDTRLRRDFADPSAENLMIQGWKFYILDTNAIDNDDPAQYTTRHPMSGVKQKAWVRPIKCGTEFWFHVDFENLTARELQLLCYALRPDADFVHRCGFGKPLQLGGVKIEPVALALIDRRQRYCAARKLLTDRQRYDRVTVEDREALAQLGQDGQPGLLHDRCYHRLLDAANSPEASDSPASAEPLSVAGLAGKFAQEIGTHHRVMQLAGTPIQVPEDRCGVTYPRLRSQDGEEDIYRWFVANRDRDGTLLQPPLPPLSDRSVSLPALKLGISIAVGPDIENRRDVRDCLRDLARERQLPLEIREPLWRNRQECVADPSVDFFIGFDNLPVGRPRFEAETLKKVGLDELKAWLEERLGQSWD